MKKIMEKLFVSVIAMALILNFGICNVNAQGIQRSSSTSYSKNWSVPVGGVSYTERFSIPTETVGTIQCSAYCSTGGDVSIGLYKRHAGDVFKKIGSSYTITKSAGTVTFRFTNVAPGTYVFGVTNKNGSKTSTGNVSAKITWQ